MLILTFTNLTVAQRSYLGYLIIFLVALLATINVLVLVGMAFERLKRWYLARELRLRYQKAQRARWMLKLRSHKESLAGANLS